MNSKHVNIVIISFMVVVGMVGFFTAGYAHGTADAGDDCIYFIKEQYNITVDEVKTWETQYNFEYTPTMNISS